MSEHKRFTADEMRDAAFWFETDGSPSDPDVEDMLRQAADAEEELAKVKASKERWVQYQDTAAGERNACIDELRKKDAEIAQLKARLAAVVKECETEKPKWIPAMECESIVKRSSMVDRYDRILRAARGEGGAE